MLELSQTTPGTIHYLSDGLEMREPRNVFICVWRHIRKFYPHYCGHASNYGGVEVETTTLSVDGVGHFIFFVTLPVQFGDLVTEIVHM